MGVYTNCPTIPHKIVSDMCETCESYDDGKKTGHHTFLAVDWGYTMTDGTCLWFCSKQCFKMSPVPTIDDGKWKWKWK